MTIIRKNLVNLYIKAWERIERARKLLSSLSDKMNETEIERTRELILQQIKSKHKKINKNT